MRKPCSSFLRAAAIALPVAALASTAMAAEPSAPAPQPPMTVLVVMPGFGFPAGMPVVADFGAPPVPLARLIADEDAFFQRQDAIMQRMIADAQAMFRAPAWTVPGDAIQVSLPALPPGTQASQILVSSVSSGRGTCSESITYAYPANGGKPQVTVHRSGNACGAGPAVIQGAPAPVSVSPEQPTRPASSQPRLYRVNDRAARPVQAQPAVWWTHRS